MNFHGGDVHKYNEDIIDFSSNINPLGVPDSFRKLLLERLEDFTRYPDIDYIEVRRRISDYLKIDNYEYILPGNGAVELIYKLVASSGAERVICLRPTFSEYQRAANAAGVEYFDIAAFNADYSTLNIEELLGNIKPRSLVIICNPNNPTGTFVKKESMKELAAALDKSDSSLIIDEAFIEFTDGYPENSMLSEVEEYKNLAIIRAATKFFGMPGLRLGYALMSDREGAEAVRGLMEPWNVNTAAVIAADCIFEDKTYIESSRAWIARERKYLFEELMKIRGLKVYPSESNFHLLRLTGGQMTAKDLQVKMAEGGVLIRTAEGFRGLSEFHFRLAVKDRRSNEMLLKKLSESIQWYNTYNK